MCSPLASQGSRSHTSQSSSAGLTPFLVKLLSEDELTTKQALHLIDLQLREQVSFQDVHELYMLDYITSIPSPHLRTCQLLVGLNTAARLVQILKGTAGSGAMIAFALSVFTFHLCPCNLCLCLLACWPFALSLGTMHHSLPHCLLHHAIAAQQLCLISQGRPENATFSWEMLA